MDLVLVDTSRSFFTWAFWGLRSFVECHLDRVFCSYDCLGSGKVFLV